MRAMRYPLTPPAFGFIVVFMFFAIAAPSLFLTAPNLAVVLTTSTEVGIVAVGVGMLMIAGEFDLSVGSVFGMSSVSFALLSNQGVNPFLSLLLVLIIALLVGALNGVITVKGKIPSFITTLGMMMFIRGLMLLRTGGWDVIYKSSDKLLLTILAGKLGDSGLRWSIAWFLALTILLFIVVDHTKYGNHILASGGNSSVARHIGVNVDGIKISAFLISALLAGFGGCVHMARFTAADSTLGTGMELETITACVIGGLSLLGGYGNILGAFVGAILISMIQAGLILIGVPGYFYIGVLGLVLVITAFINNYFARRIRVMR
jgi:simple sugar transport system permease protein